MEYTAAHTPKTDRKVYLPEGCEEAWLDSAETLLELALAPRDRALAALRDQHVPEALSRIEGALHLAPHDVGVARAATLMALQHDDHELAREAVGWLERYETEEAPRFRKELEQRIERWNEHLERPGALREKYAAADPDASYRELVLLREHFGDKLTAREREHLRRWDLAAPESKQHEQQTHDATRPAFTGVASAALGWLLGALWRR
jgi:hypothetical protein